MTTMAERAKSSLASPWLTVEDAAAYARCRGPKAIYRAVKHTQLRAARINERGDLRFKAEWIDAWLEAAARTGIESVRG